MESQKPVRPEPGPGPGMCGCDRDLFLRVWSRVMPEERPDCPISVDRQQGMDEPAVPAMQMMPVPAASVMQNVSVDVDQAADDFPARDDVPCLGSGAVADQGRLQELIVQELACWKAYQMLARRGGQGGRILSALAGNCRRRAKRLSAALFLVSGMRYWPAEQTSAPAPHSYFAALREHFLEEQNRGCGYRAAAEDCRDHCLRMLYLEMADECAEHACRIRSLLETM